jgi:hypothetical protein
VESRPDNAVERLAGPEQSWSSVRRSIESLQTRNLDGLVSLTTLPFDGRLFWLARFEDGRVLRLDENGNARNASSVDLSAAALRIAGKNAIESAVLSETEDSYYFQFQGFAEREPLIWPVYRVIVADDEHTIIIWTHRMGGSWRALIAPGVVIAGYSMACIASIFLPGCAYAPNGILSCFFS